MLQSTKPSSGDKAGAPGGEIETINARGPHIRWMPLFLGSALLAAACIPLAGCKNSDPNKVQGYVEGEFVYVASPMAGALQSLAVKRGTQVKAGDPLFSLENGSETAARNQAARLFAQARATLDDEKTGKRPTEIASAEAQLKQSRAALDMSEKDLERQDSLIRTGAISVQDFQQARSTRDQNRQQVDQLGADLETARLGARIDEIAAAQAGARASEAALAKAQWDLDQKTQNAPKAGLVFDTLYYEGEWVAAGRPVISLLPPGQIKVRAFVPEPRIGAVHVGDRVQVSVDGVSVPLKGRVSFISPNAEYTPPVIYSRESRSKLVFMIEVEFDPKIAENLHPGQPVDIQFGS
jgi:HlyD family secretion protein